MKKMLVLEISDIIHTKIKTRAAEQGLSIKVYVTRVLLERLARDEQIRDGDD